MMKQLAASARLPLSDPRRSALDLSWSFSLSRSPGSDDLAARMTLAALTTIGGAPAPCERIAEATALACRYVLEYGFARRYRITVAVDDARCAVSVTDYGYDQPAVARAAVTHAPTDSYETTRLCQELSEFATNGTNGTNGTRGKEGVEGKDAVDGSGELKIDGIQVHHALDGAVLVRFRAGPLLSPELPSPRPASADASKPPPDAPGTSRSPGARG